MCTFSSRSIEIWNTWYVYWLFPRMSRVMSAIDSYGWEKKNHTWRFLGARQYSIMDKIKVLHYANLVSWPTYSLVKNYGLYVICRCFQSLQNALLPFTHGSPCTEIKVGWEAGRHGEDHDLCFAIYTRGTKINDICVLVKKLNHWRFALEKMFHLHQYFSPPHKSLMGWPSCYWWDLSQRVVEVWSIVLAYKAEAEVLYWHIKLRLKCCIGI